MHRGRVADLPSERSDRRRRAVEGEWAWMDGHRLQWRRMAVLGSWPDGDAGVAEAEAITYVKDQLPHCLTNRCADARGLEIRSYGYSFVYICFDLLTPVLQKDMGG